MRLAAFEPLSSVVRVAVLVMNWHYSNMSNWWIFDMKGARTSGRTRKGPLLPCMREEWEWERKATRLRRVYSDI